MTTKEKILTIKRACAKVNPLIYESTSGDWFRKTGDEDYDSENVASKAKIGIVDILMAINFDHTTLDPKSIGIMGADGFFMERGAERDSGYNWKMRKDDIDEQDKDTIDFIFNHINNL